MFTIGFGMFVSQALCSDCNWAEETPDADSEYLYIIGHGYSNDSCDAANKKAENDFDKQICDSIGSHVSYSMDSYETDKNSDAASASAQSVICPGIYKENVVVKKSGCEKQDGTYHACKLYKYSQKSLRQEQDRIKKEGYAPGSMSLSERGIDAKCAGQRPDLVIRTNPRGAFVSLDDISVHSGNTPVRFTDVCGGVHKLKIRMDNFETIIKDIDDNTIDLYETLKRKTKSVKITTNLGDSKIIIKDSNGFVIDRGKEPFVYEFKMGIEYQVSAENDDASSLTKGYKTTESSPSSLFFDLDRYPGKIDFKVFKHDNPGVNIRVDGKELKDDVTGDLKSGISHIIVFTKPGFESITRSQFVKPNDTFYYPSDELDFEAENSKPVAKEEVRIETKVPQKGNDLKDISRFWFGIRWNKGSYNLVGDYSLTDKDAYYALPMQEFGVTSNIFLSKTFIIDLAATYGKVNFNFETSDPYLDNNRLNFYGNISEIGQKFNHYYAGAKWYLLSDAGPFIGGGYNWYNTIEFSYTLNDCSMYDTSLYETYFEENMKFNKKGPSASVGFGLGIFEISYTWGSTFTGMSLDFVIPL